MVAIRVAATGASDLVLLANGTVDKLEGADGMSGKGATFRALHQEPGGFIIPNPWDIGTAQEVAGMGFRALAGMAFSLGCRRAA